MAEQLAQGFGGLLRQLRAEAELTQEELAGAASLSPRSVSDLERGINRTARKDTAELLAGALGLAEPTRALFVAAARGRAPAEEVLAALRGEAVAPGDPAAGQGPAWPGGPYLGSCRSRSGTPGCFTDVTSWRIGWCGGWRIGWTRRGYCW
jgi:transcriptional regulator with XRE-family HTH domain